MKNLLMVFIFIFLISGAYAICKEGGIDLNSANFEELQKINYIGPARAESIINHRTHVREFRSVDDLVWIYGIAEGILAKVKEQGLACVANENISDRQIIEEENPIFEKVSSEQRLVVEGTGNVIKISPKDIKSEDDTKIISRNKYAISSFVIFCILILFLFFVRRVKLRKNVLE
jgi:competence ComEA-like helix-hairpin-helix protein